MTKYVLVSQGIKIFETYDEQEAKAIMEKSNQEYYRYAERCAEENERAQRRIGELNKFSIGRVSNINVIAKTIRICWIRLMIV